MKRIALFLNSPYLGGAERSILSQLNKVCENNKITVFLPRLDDDSVKDIKKEIIEFGFGEPIEFQFPKALYSFSRKGKISWLNILYSPIELLSYFFFKSDKLKLKSFDIVWGNGNKVSLLVYLICLIRRYSGRFVWHFRDYPTNKFPYTDIKVSLQDIVDNVKKISKKSVSPKPSSLE